MESVGSVDVGMLSMSFILSPMVICSYSETLEALAFQLSSLIYQLVRLSIRFMTLSVLILEEAQILNKF
ncbi:hypothetical protein LINPERHAP2_LOCUS12522 [Linum perenne]